MSDRDFYDKYINYIKKNNNIENLNVKGKEFLIFNFLKNYVPNFSTSREELIEDVQDYKCELFQKLYIIWVLNIMSIDVVRLVFKKVKYEKKFIIYNIGSLEFSISTPFLITIDTTKSLLETNDSSEKEKNLLRSINIIGENILEEILKFYIPNNLPQLKQINYFVNIENENIISGDFIYNDKYIAVYRNSDEYYHFVCLYCESNAFLISKYKKNIKLNKLNIIKKYNPEIEYINDLRRIILF